MIVATDALPLLGNWLEIFQDSRDPSCLLLNLDCLFIATLCIFLNSLSMISDSSEMQQVSCYILVCDRYCSTGYGEL